MSCGRTRLFFTRRQIDEMVKSGIIKPIKDEKIDPKEGEVFHCLVYGTGFYVECISELM